MINKTRNNRTQAVIKVMLADDHHVVRKGVRSELERHPDIQVIGEAENGKEILEQVSRLQPDVLVLDINLPGMLGTQVTELLREMPKPTSIDPGRIWPPSILILSAYVEQEYVFNLFAAGAKGYLLKDEPPERIAEGIRQVYQGEPSLSIPVQKMLLLRKPELKHDLSERELEVLRLMAKGNTNEEIAEALFITVGTVKNHVTNIYKKLPNVNTRSEAVAWAWQNRIVEID